LKRRSKYTRNFVAGLTSGSGDLAKKATLRYGDRLQVGGNREWKEERKFDLFNSMEF